MKTILPSIMKKYSLQLVSAIFVVLFFVTYTSAIFTDQETSEGNSLSAGTLDLQVDDKDNPFITTFNFSDMSPGDNETHSFTLKNTGTLPGVPKICLRNVINTESTGSSEFESDGDAGELGANINVIAKINGESLVDTDTSLDSFNDHCWASENVLDTEFVNTNADILDPSETAIFEFNFSITESVGNEIQGDSVTFDVEFNFEQN